MTKPLLDLSGKIDPALIEVCRTVAHCAEALKIPYLVVGAFARDLVMHYGYSAPIQRATTDIDFALQLPSWDAFYVLKQELVANKFTEAKAAHRLIAPNNLPIDIVPFGKIADQNANIEWPPSGDLVMTILGFEEALSNADIIRLKQDPRLDLPVASPVGMIILKLIAWMDREADVRHKDAKDIAYLLNTYEAIPAVSAQLYDNQNTLEEYGWDLVIAGAFQLGVEASRIASVKTTSAISNLFNSGKSTVQLINEMANRMQQYSRQEEVLNAFRKGFINKPS